MCGCEHVPNPFIRLHNWWLSFVEKHSNWKLVVQLFFGAILSFAGAVLLSKVQYFINYQGWQKFYSYWLGESMPGLIYLALALIFGLYVIISIVDKDNRSKKDDIKEILRLLRRIDGEGKDSSHNITRA